VSKMRKRKFSLLAWGASLARSLCLVIVGIVLGLFITPVSGMGDQINFCLWIEPKQYVDAGSAAIVTLPSNLLCPIAASSVLSPLVENAVQPYSGDVAIGILALVILLSAERITRSLNDLRQEKAQARESSDQALIHAHRQMVITRIRSEGWLAVASQLIADALAEPVAISLDAGLLDVSCSPAPRFAVSGINGQRFFFTVKSALLQQRRLISCRARWIALENLGPMASVEVQALWNELMCMSGMAAQVFAPRDAQWFIVVEDPRTAHLPVRVSLRRVFGLIDMPNSRSSR